MSISIVLCHDHYNKDHLEDVKREMQILCEPTINCWYDDVNSLWFAVEGCHRLRAAYALGITPIINDISNDSTLTYQVEGEDVTVVLTEDFFNEWYDHNYHNTILDFKEED